MRADAIELSSEDLIEIENAISKISIQGDRYSEEDEKDDWSLISNNSSNAS